MGLILVMALLSCNQSLPKVEHKIAPVNEIKGDVLIGHYIGTLPCAGCSGLKTELTLYGATTMESYKYTLRETYLSSNAGDKVVERSGAYNFERGNSTDDDAVIYVLDPDSAKNRRFWMQNDSTVLAVDDKGDVPGKTANFILRKN